MTGDHPYACKTPDCPKDCCDRCWQRREVCLCHAIPRVETRTEILIIRHLFEAHRSSNTARIAHLALPNSRIIDYGGGYDFDGALLAEPGTWLLHPDPGGSVPEGPPRRLVLLDGSWRQARKMLLRIEGVRALPRLKLSAPSVPVARLRQPPRADGLSTIEAVAAALALMEGEAAATPLKVLFGKMVQGGLYMRGLAFDGERLALRR